LGIIHEDVLLKMFRYSLEGKAREWCRSLPPSSFSSLKDFHTAFHSYCKRIYPAKCLLNNCCEQFEFKSSLNNNDQEGFGDGINQDIFQENESQHVSTDQMHEEIVQKNKVTSSMLLLLLKLMKLNCFLLCS